MTGYDEATQWLLDNAPGWRVVEARTTLRPAVAYGLPTEQLVEVRLIEAAVAERLAMSHPADITLYGEGPTILDAVQRAVGGLPTGEHP